MPKAALIYSGGSDSYTLLHYLLSGSFTVECISFDYFQRHRKELIYAEEECKRLNVPQTFINLPFLSHITLPSALTNKKIDIPEGFYTAESMKQTVVPNRNMIMLAIAASYAISEQCDLLCYGAHQGDHDIYPDCRPAFVQAMSAALSLCDWHEVKLWAPFLMQDKRAIYTWGLQNGLDYSKAWSCYNGRELACGRCGACVERLHAFYDIGATDPLVYEDKLFWREAAGVAT